jgi:hypothetical protein
VNRIAEILFIRLTICSSYDIRASIDKVHETLLLATFCHLPPGRLTRTPPAALSN